MERRKFITGSAVLAVGLAGCAASDDDDEPTVVDDDNGNGDDATGADDDAGNGDEEEGEDVEVVIGELVSSDDLELVVESAERVTELDEFTEADPGNEFVVVRLAYKNVSDDHISVSGLLQTRLRDDEDYSYDQSLFGTGESLNDGQVVPGEVERGDVVYEVPEDASGLELEFDFDIGLFSGIDRVTVNLESEDDVHQLEQDLQVDVHDIGQTIEYSGIEITVNDVEFETDLDDFTQAEEGHEYAIVDITVSNQSGEEQRVSTALQMMAKDEDGFSYREDFGAAAALDQSYDESAELADGEDRRGKVAYEVEEGLSPLYWVFEFDLLDDGDKTFWQLR
ncbi:DUF4352 domain-containing protein [Natrononativus amylolyticus]|uniref:DUF4352 domain-containing protein n=1 Tax=Natrononativus amylolyticus TaxID=2963434 RepID=UPI0020CC9E0D|nr:DUF4352 domain-containing protein [Natrononativus amylolyticus]